MKLFQNLIVIFCICAITSCKEEYYPKVKPSAQSLLVVEGVINTTGATKIRLTRTTDLSVGAQSQPEGGAAVVVESQSGDVFPLYEQFGSGDYNTDQLNLDPSEKYRLHISTAAGKEYASDYVAVQKNPPIDSIGWNRDANGITINVNTHDPESKTHYYRWEYEETWETHAAYYAIYKLVNNAPVARQLPEEQVYDCWKYHNSSELLLGATTQVAGDVVSEKKLNFIPTGDEKFSVRYSVLVRQFALSKEAYAFYELMKKNTESLGSIFDAQPSELRGNIHALSDSTENVIGYVSIAPGQESRIFITREQVPNWNFQQYCSFFTEVPNNPDSFAKYFGGGGYSPFNDHRIGLQLVGYYASYPECVDCTFRGGSTQKPSYW